MSCSSHATQYQLFVGVDIAATTATVAWQSLKQKPSKPITIEQTPEGFSSLHQRLTRTGAMPDQILVVMEATGVYWFSLATFLARQGYAISVVNPAQAHHFAKALLKRAKTDAIDAQTLTQLAALLPSEKLQTPSPADHSPDQAWARTIARLQTIPGIGLLTALWIVVTTMNFTLCSSAEQAAAYAGLAPMPRESGTSVHKRPCIGHTGNGRLRTALYLATLSAARYNPTIKRFYDRLRGAGKPAKVARCAAARKLLHLASAVGTNLEDFDPHYQPKNKQQVARA